MLYSLARARMSAARSEFGSSSVIGATDSRYFEPIADDVYRFLFNVLGPEDLPRIHGTDERIAVVNHSNAIRFYHQLMKRLQ